MTSPSLLTSHFWQRELAVEVTPRLAERGTFPAQAVDGSEGKSGGTFAPLPLPRPPEAYRNQARAAYALRNATASFLRPALSAL